MFRTRQLPFLPSPTATSPKRRTQPRYLRFWVHHGRGGEKVVRFPETQTFVPDNWWLERRNSPFFGGQSHICLNLYVIVLGRVCVCWILFFFLVILTSLLHLSMECKFPFRYHLTSECVLLDTFSQAWIEKANRCESSCHSFRKYFAIHAPNVEGHQQPLSSGTRIPKKRVKGLPS